MASSIAQLKDEYKQEIEDWATTYNIDLTFEETIDLVDSLIGLSHMHLQLPDTCDTDDEHYN